MKLSIYIVIMLFAAFRLYARLKRSMTESAAPAADYNSSDSTFDQEYEVADVVSDQPSPSAEASYFTYEAPDANVGGAFKSTPASAQPVQQESVATDEVAPRFDLRQAVIYQTLLDNSYINHVK